MNHRIQTLASFAVGCLLAGNVVAQTSSKSKIFTVNADQVYGEMAPTMYGIFFEDINLGADGGIYAELVKSRSFEFDTPLMGWEELKPRPWLSPARSTRTTGKAPSPKPRS